MDVVYAEVEITSSLPATKLFKVYNDFDTIAPKINPEFYKSINIIKVDGGAGSIKSITYGDGKTSKHTVDVIDTSSLIIGLTLFEGDVFMGIIKTGTHHMKFIPSPNGGSIFKQTFVIRYEGDSKLIDDVINHTKEEIKNTFKKMESYAIAHPEVY